jgi:AcrR family transcriptional regulator
LQTKGAAAATFEEISKRSRYSRGLVGQRFGSKEGLIEAIIAYHGDDETGVTPTPVTSDNQSDCFLDGVDDYQLDALAAAPFIWRLETGSHSGCPSPYATYARKT